jgi:uncharacterized membrane protein YeaQ/YmgE (transglycosylase-associated protein family)
MEDENHGQKVVSRYREKAVWGGTVLGLLVGAIVGGPSVASWSEPIKMYAIYILVGGVIGAIAGFLFYEIFLSGLASAGPGSSIQSPDNKSGSGIASADAMDGSHD